jgi:hypothetical protein
MAWITEADYATRRNRVWYVDSDDAGRAPRELFEYDTDDRSQMPGSPVIREHGRLARPTHMIAKASNSSGRHHSGQLISYGELFYVAPMRSQLEDLSDPLHPTVS